MRAYLRALRFGGAALLFTSFGVCAETVALVGGTVIDGRGGTPVTDGVIVIEGNRIVASGDRRTPIPTTARRIPVLGKYIIPGLMDANVHLVLDNWPVTLARFEGRYDELAIEAAQVALAGGVTTVFDSWGPRRFLVKARDAVNGGQVVGPRIYLAGNIVGLGGPFTQDFFPQFRAAVQEDFAARIDAQWQENVGPELQWMSPEQIRQQVREYVRKDIDFVKFAVNGHNLESMGYIEFSPRAQQVIVEEARRAGLTVQTHTTSIEGLALAVQAGVDLMQHCDITGPREIPAETVTLIASRRIPCAFLAQTDRALAWYREKASKSPLAAYLGVADRNERMLLNAGAVILLSTDGGVFSSNTLKGLESDANEPPEESLRRLGTGHFHWLLAMEQKGLEPMAALLAATRNIARAYKVDRDLGTLEPGKLADLVVLDANPLEGATNYRRISMVMKAGQLIDRNALPTRRLLTEGLAPGAPH